VGLQPHIKSFNSEVVRWEMSLSCVDFVGNDPPYLFTAQKYYAYIVKNVYLHSPFTIYAELAGNIHKGI
jgi:hypothetical protein